MADSESIELAEQRRRSIIEAARRGQMKLLGAGLDVVAPTDWLADPEAACVLASGDGASPRALQEFGTWMKHHDRLFSAARLRAWSKRLPLLSIDHRELVAVAREAARDRDLGPTDPSAPSQTRVRLRGLLGSGSRVEIVLILLQREVSSVANLSAISGFSKVALQLEIRELVGQGWAHHSETQPRGYVASEALRALVGPLPTRASLPWFHLLATFNSTRRALESLRRGTRGADLEAASLVREGSYRSHVSGIEWGKNVASGAERATILHSLNTTLTELEFALGLDSETT